MIDPFFLKIGKMVSSRWIDIGELTFQVDFENNVGIIFRKRGQSGSILFILFPYGAAF